jgi:leucine dehydrogenase
MEDMVWIHMETPYVVTLPESYGGAGPISPVTAFGVLQGMKACCGEIFGDSSLQGRKVAVQGIGSVGLSLTHKLVEEQAKIVVCDIDQEKVQAAVKEFDVQVVSVDAIYEVECDIFSPCALGGILNDVTIPKLNCKIVAGSANNQLREDRHGEMLRQRGILYAPDYIINAGGTIFDTDRLITGIFNNQRAMDKVARIFQTVNQVLASAKEQDITTNQAADLLAEGRIQQMREVRRI